MDGSRFDHLAKELVIRADRRRVLQGVRGTLAAVLGLSLGSELIAAKGGKHRKHGSQRHKRRARAARKPGGGTPQGRCADGQTNCRGKCVFLQEDRHNCGACATVCPESRSCCGGQCVVLQSDVNSCGGCGVRCRSNEQCVNGQCQCGLTVCSSNEQCVNGQCQCGSTVCSSGQICLPNDTCARPCTQSGNECATCTTVPNGCGAPSIENQRVCIDGNVSCDSVNPCDPTNTQGCPQGFVCIQGQCPGPRCVPVAVCP